MKIGVISDTHLTEPTSNLLRVADRIFKDVQMVLHAGDLTHAAILDVFGEKEIIAVCGNMDVYEVSTFLPDRRVVQVKNYRIGLTHGWGRAERIEDRIRSSFNNVDAIVYGHTHKAVNYRREDGVLMFNPGAFSGRFPFKQNGSVGILTIGDEITGEIIEL